MAKNTLHVIGWLGIKHCYLNIPLEEAKRRYLQDTNPDPEGEPDTEIEDHLVRSFEFDDEFGAYDAWPQS